MRGGLLGERARPARRRGASSDYAQITPPEPLPVLAPRAPAGAAQSLIIAITSDNLQASDAAVAAGATAHGIDELDGFHWSTLDDPEGNPFTFNAPPPR